MIRLIHAGLHEREMIKTMIPDTQSRSDLAHHSAGQPETIPSGAGRWGSLRRANTSLTAAPVPAAVDLRLPCPGDVDLAAGPRDVGAPGPCRATPARWHAEGP